MFLWIVLLNEILKLKKKNDILFIFKLIVFIFIVYVICFQEIKKMINKLKNILKYNDKV